VQKQKEESEKAKDSIKKQLEEQQNKMNKKEESFCQKLREKSGNNSIASF
jgi:hypothetical protein